MLVNEKKVIEYCQNSKQKLRYVKNVIRKYKYSEENFSDGKNSSSKIHQNIENRPSLGSFSLVIPHQLRNIFDSRAH